MTEGPRAHAVAHLINRVAKGRVLVEAYARSRKLRFPVESLVGRRLDRAEAFGKNIVLFFGEHALRVHTLIYGKVRVYRRGEKYEKPEKQVWLKLVFGDYEVVGFNTPIIEVDLAGKVVSELARKLGPDPLRDSWSREVAVERLRSKCGEKIGVVLLDQGVIAGVGNILRNEALFIAKINPEREVCSLTIEELESVVKAVEHLSRLYYEKTVEGENLKKYYRVYNKYRGYCPICGARIVYYRQQPCNRKTFICPNCQRL